MLSSKLLTGFSQTMHGVRPVMMKIKCSQCERWTEGMEEDVFMVVASFLLAKYSLHSVTPTTQKFIHDRPGSRT